MTSPGIVLHVYSLLMVIHSNHCNAENVLSKTYHQSVLIEEGTKASLSVLLYNATYVYCAEECNSLVTCVHFVYNSHSDSCQLFLTSTGIPEYHILPTSVTGIELFALAGKI